MFKFKPTPIVGEWAFTTEGEDQFSGIYFPLKDGKRFIANTLEADLAMSGNEISDQLDVEFTEFQTSNPIYALGLPFNQFKSVEESKQLYIDLLKACVYSRYDDPEQAEKAFNRLMAWLVNTDLFIAPASTYHHESYPGGLIEHSLRVAHQIRSLIQIPSFASIDFASAVMVALTHDWSKINRYEQYIKNVKNEATGQWEPTKAYRRIPSKIPFTHGTASMWIAQRFFRLSLEEGLAIAYHMGRWDVADSAENELSDANKAYPLVYALQFADQLAITEYQR